MELALLKTGGGVDTSELTATENDVVSPYTFYGKDDEEKDTGGVTNKGKKTHTLAANGTYAVEEGYYESITVNQSLATYAGATVNPGKKAPVGLMIYFSRSINPPKHPPTTGPNR